MKLSKKLKAAMKNYYSNCARAQAREEGFTWDKMADIEAIVAALPKGTWWQASAGTFWFGWKNPRVVTVHSGTNWWTCKIYARWDKQKKAWVHTGAWA